ncbi:MAG: hypothetical protein RLZZ129_772, partial [Verrucomicrobiota bacterium]
MIAVPDFETRHRQFFLHTGEHHHVTSPRDRPQALDNLRALNPGDNDEFLRELAAIFLEDTPKRITELDASLAAGDAAT